jgi:hypothetical protein
MLSCILRKEGRVVIWQYTSKGTALYAYLWVVYSGSALD